MTARTAIDVRRAGNRLGRAAWADAPAEVLADLVDLSRSVPWRRALEQVDPAGSFFSRRMLNLQLGNWHLLLMPDRTSRVLDVGCGFGSLALGMAECYESAFGVEVLPDRVEWAALRAKQDGLRARFARASGFDLPFSDGAFGLATLNGVLEWAGLYRAGPPRTLQVRMLEEVRRVLQPDGHVAVAIENRYALESLLGLKDTHSGLTGVTFLPRAAADLWSRLRKGEPYRTYLYGPSAWQGLLRRAGFGGARVFDLVSSYNDYDFVVDTRDALSYRLIFHNEWARPFYGPAARVRRRLADWAPGLLGRLGYAHLVIGGNAALTALDAESPIWTAAARYGADPGRARFACQGTAPGMLALVAHDGTRVCTVVELSVRTSDGADPTALNRRVRVLAGDRRIEFAGAGEIGGLEVRVHRVRAGIRRERAEPVPSLTSD